MLARGTSRFKSQELANTAWAYAKTSQVLSFSLRLSILACFTSTKLANTAWAYAKTSQVLSFSLLLSILALLAQKDKD